MSSIILASSSKYRQTLLARLGITFECISPAIDESPLTAESPLDLVKRLSIDKANKVAQIHPEKFVLGSDQVAVFNQTIIGKPGTFEAAFKQLSQFSGNNIQFLTGVTLINRNEKVCSFEYSEVTVKFRHLSEQQIGHYLEMDQPFDCAGSFKVEKFGISLFESILSDDPTSLEGLPLIKVCSLLKSVNLLY
jgi:septum formation protein